MTLDLNQSQINALLAALILANTRYNTEHNGGIHYDFSFKNVADQNSYADYFESVENEIREQIKNKNT